MAKRERSNAINGYDARAAVVKARNQAKELPEDVMAFVYAALSGNQKRAEEIGREISRKSRAVSECLDGALDGKYEGIL